MDIDAQTLKESYLGRVVLFYTKAPRVQGPIKRQADNLVQAWSRPILGRSSDMRNRKVVNIKDLDLTAAAEDIEMAAGAGGGEDQEGSQRYSQSQGQASQKPRKKRVDWNERAEINTTAKGARLEKASVCFSLCSPHKRSACRTDVILIIQDFQYQIAPESMHKGKDRERDEHMRRIQMDNSRFNKFARQMRGGKAGGRG
jgi:transcription factor SPN1